ncbi:MAG: 4-hydroxythreonine-4-phosphate dehydrogenase PdxA [Polyangiales bacterium]
MSGVSLAVSAGCPCGIGPEVSVAAAHTLLDEDPEVRITLYGDAGALAAQLGPRARPARLEVAPVSALPADARRPGQPGPAAGRAQLDAIDRAVDAVLAGRAHALVTAPVSKSAIHGAGVNFLGHTEHLAARAGVPRVVMSFLGPRLRVALVTTHVAIAKLPASITADLVRFTIVTATRAMQRDLGIARPRVVVAGLNPHAGEGGMFGDDEALRVDPGIALAQQEVKDAQIVGAMPAESAFRHARDGRYDLVVAMFHDQATIASKLVDFGEAVNVTLGLPFLRTSVDHGTAYDIAGRGVADPHGMLAALRLAATMARRRAQVVFPPQDDPAPAVHPKQ